MAVELHAAEAAQLWRLRQEKDALELQMAKDAALRRAGLDCVCPRTHTPEIRVPRVLWLHGPRALVGRHSLRRARAIDPTLLTRDGDGATRSENRRSSRACGARFGGAEAVCYVARSCVARARRRRWNRMSVEDVGEDGARGDRVGGEHGREWQAARALPWRLAVWRPARRATWARYMTER